MSPMLEEMLVYEVEMEFGDAGTLHDVIAPHAYQGRETDPAEEAARNLDWEWFLASHPPRHRTAILVLVEGGTMREAGKLCGIKDSAALVLKRRIAAYLIAFFGEEVIRRLLDGVRPGWECNLRTARDRHTCHVTTAAELSRVQPRVSTPSPESLAWGFGVGCGFLAETACISPGKEPPPKEFLAKRYGELKSQHDESSN